MADPMSDFLQPDFMKTDFMRNYQALGQQSWDAWVPAGHTPTVEEALARLDQLRAHGPTPEAFTFKQRFPPPGTIGDPVNMRPEPYCVL